MANWTQNLKIRLGDLEDVHGTDNRSSLELYVDPLHYSHYYD